MRNMERVIFGCLMLCGFIPGAWACTTAAWNGGNSGGTAGSPPTISRVSELCALELTGTGWVQDDSPAHSAMIARFYVYPNLNGSGEADLFVAYSSETPSGVLFDVAFDGTNFDFSAAGAGGGTGSSPAEAGWNLIEVAFNSGGTFSFWVNANATSDPATGTFNSGSGTVQAVRLGLPNGLGGFSDGFVRYDAYESRATTPVGPLLIGDANADDTVNVIDYSSVQQDILGNLQLGQPDCNLDGTVNVLDYGCVQSVILGG